LSPVGEARAIRYTDLVLLTNTGAVVFFLVSPSHTREDGLVNSEILFGEEVAELTRIPIATLRFYRSAGKGPRSFKLGNRVVYKRSDVEAWIQEQYAAAVGGDG
jgi:predicted DNA-binding transcriptional regulator AlpA